MYLRHVGGTNASCGPALAALAAQTPQHGECRGPGWAAYEMEYSMLICSFTAASQEGS